MPFGGFLALGALGAAGSVAGGLIQAGAQEDIAKAQAAEAARIRDQALQFAAPTAKELENLQKQYQLYEKMYAQQNVMLQQAEKQLVETYGPAVLEQGQQLFQQLKGESAGVVKSYDSQRSRQREQLKQQLLERMGPDALTSSAGIQALNQFDTQTSEQRAGIEEQALSNSVSRLTSLSQGQGGLSSIIGNAYTSLGGMLNQIQGTLGNFQTRQVNAVTSTAPAVIGTAGSENVGRMGLGQAISSGFGQLSNLGGQAMMFSALGGGKTTTTQQQPQDTGFSSGQGTFGQFNPQSPLTNNELTFNQFGSS